MTLVAIIAADDPCPPHSMVPACLEKILGDPVLLWQLRALPNSVTHVYVLTGDDHEKIANAISGWKPDGGLPNDIECLKSQGLAKSICGLSDKAGIKAKAKILLFKPNQPLIAPKAFQRLAATTGILTAAGQANGQQPAPCPVSLPWPALHAAAQRMLEQAKTSIEGLLAHISDATELVPVICGHGDLLPVKTRRDQIMVESVARERIIGQWIDLGVGFLDPGSAFIGPRVELARRGVWIGPQARLEGRGSVGEGTAIGQGSIIRNSIIGANAEIRPYCVINDSVIGNGSKIGPFAHLREGTQLDSGVHIGNYVETKKALLRAGAKANHLSYLGDCEVGEKSNIGAGCITCNYDGANKHRTKIGRDAFVGSDCQLVAPVTVGNGAILAAGTTLTTDVPDDALALTRPETTIKEGGATKIRAKLKLGSSSVSS